jgi:hypothetical protein
MNGFSRLCLHSDPGRPEIDCAHLFTSGWPCGRWTIPDACGHRQTQPCAGSHVASTKRKIRGVTSRPMRHGREEATARIGVAAAIPAVLMNLGADPAEVLAEAGVDHKLVDDPDDLVSYAARGHRWLIARPGPTPTISSSDAPHEEMAALGDSLGGCPGSGCGRLATVARMSQSDPCRTVDRSRSSHSKPQPSRSMIRG